MFLDQYLFRAENINNKRILHFKGPDNFSTTTFFLRVVDEIGVNIRPGDDILFRFTLADFEENITSPAIASSGDFMAVYDKKLLDRANQYIDEGDGDWNGNDQIDISPWTRFSDSVVIDDAVAYSKGCADWVDHFNDDLEEQQSAITAYFANTNNTTINPNPNPDSHRGWSPWNNTWAPNGDWDNYLIGTLQGANYTALTIDGTVHNPYTPGFSSWRVTNGGYRAHDTGYSSGVDCSGYVQRCLDYDNNNYTVPSVGNRLTWGSTTPGLIGPGGFGGNTYTWEVVDRTLLVIGDIVHCDGHVGIVWKIEHDNNSRDVDYKNVTIIEPTGSVWKVRNDRTWYDWREAPTYFPNISIRRVRIN